MGSSIFPSFEEILGDVDSRTMMFCPRATVTGIFTAAFRIRFPMAAGDAFFRFFYVLSLSLSLHRQPPVSSNRKRKRAERSYAWLHNRRGRLRRQRRSDSAATYAEPTGLSTAWQPTPTQSAVVDVRWMITAAISVRQHDG